MSAIAPSKGSKVVAYAVLTIAAVAALFPIFWTLSTSIKNRVDSFAIPPTFFDFEPTWANYRNLFGDDLFVRFLVNTVIVTVVSTMMSLVIGSMTAYALARTRRFRGRRALEASLIVVRAMPGIVLMIPLFRLVLTLGLFDNIWVMCLVYATVNLPFTVWVMTSFIDQIPYDLEESALVDGAGRWSVLFRVVLPVAAPGLAATGIFVALLAWNEFLIPVVIADVNAKVLPVFIAGFISARTLDWGPMAAASSLAIIPIALLT
ncbi:MAG: carbohydrate ABC transporter permease, partial [Acidimicrobiia bacterium]|nr:carbohydrate ABC transporter permease [Acidimicrobiia bacterium]